MKRKIVWIYCRGAYHNDKALTIQEKLLTNYAKSNNMEVCGITSESGSDSTLFHAGLNEVNKKVQSGEIHCLVVKDITRLGRDLFQVGEYIE